MAMSPDAKKQSSADVIADKDFANAKGSHSWLGGFDMTHRESSKS